MNAESRNPVTIRGLTKQFRTGWREAKEVLTSVDLDVPRGAIVGLLGVNGSGKTTLLKMLVGLLRADAGEVRVFGDDPWTMRAATKRRIGYVPQEVRVAPWMSVAEVVRYTAAFYGTQWNRSWAEELLDRFHLERGDRAGTLSGGQTQKLGLVLALGHRPELLLLDEPVASLDPLARRELLATLVQLAEETADSEHSQTVLFSTHITADLERVATHVALLKNGRVTLFDEIDSLKEMVQRVRVTSATSLPDQLPEGGLLHLARDSRTLSATLSDGGAARWQAWAEAAGAECAIELLNLEELFIELHESGGA
ncbi:MAG: ABC transporter ATP-binding protein [Planctomycetota bacterium]|nr:ABC transporter ATP-binding protein [Planctomycetota bacterium]MDA0969804.1 ABC transporter ATP-binding protein [Planctomycetota bacterium]